jgi:hypothetical protein
MCAAQTNSSRQGNSQQIARLIAGLHPNRDPGIRVLEEDWRRANIKKELLAIARKSLKARANVIQSLISTIQDPATNTNHGLWLITSEIIAELRAAEALDFLIEHIDYNLYFTLSLSGFPVLRAIVKFGDAAIPKLEEALHRPDASIATRYLAGTALGMIGGAKAKQGLERALKVEANEIVLNTIRWYLTELSKVPPKSIGVGVVR